MHQRARCLTAAAAAAICWASVAADDSLTQGFHSPPPSARPWVYWFWLNGNITRAGITADLEAMARVGVGGVLIMEVDQGAPLGPAAFMSAEWRELFAHVVAEAGRLGLEVNMNNDAGWNGSGGPWITPEQSMQKVVWSETAVEGPGRRDAVLPEPPRVAGFYRDIAVLAVPSVGAFRIDNILVKACYQVGEVGPAATAAVPAGMAIDRGRIADLTSAMDATGRLVWDVPEGKWTVLRVGHTSTGVQNAPAPASGRGLECDKLSKEGIEANFAGMMAKLIADAGPAAGKALAATHIDSWENGAQNWTARMREEFQARRGYALPPFLPVMTGRVVDSLEVSERFLWDLRRTISELVVENYAGHLRTLAQRHGMRLSIEAYGGPCDNQPYAGRADEPMCEFWIGGGAMSTCKEMASAAHTYGKNIMGAEAFTAADQERWLEHPASIKALGDRAFCDGVNRFVFHRYAMQPWADRRPGMTMGPWGIHYERTQTWWAWTPAWHAYLARCQFMLRRGLPFADICRLQPEAAPQSARAYDRRSGYDYDTIGAEALLARMRVEGGRLVLPDGASYRLLVLPDGRVMTPRLLARIKELVEAGATVVGPRPEKSPSLSGYPACDAEVARLADALWGPCDGTAVTEHRCGKGRIVWGVAPERVLALAGVPPDFTGPARLSFIHRADGAEDIYFVASPLPHDVRAACTFRVSGKAPELWWPDTGRIEPAPVWHEKDGRTTVAIPFGPSGSVFVVFRPAAGPCDPVAAIARDGAPVLSSIEETPAIVVARATYGIPGDERRTRDVRAKIQAKVDRGEVEFQVATLASGDDPAVNVVKTLTVEYAIGGRRRAISARDPDRICLTGDATPIVIDRAVYGVLDDPARTRDVRAKVQRMADAGERVFDVTRLAHGDDPAFGIVKTAIVEYRIGGVRRTASGTDLDVLYLAAEDPAERIADCRRGARGEVILSAWRPGVYTVAMGSGTTHKARVPSVPAAAEVRGPWQVRFPEGWGAPPSIVLPELASWSEHADPGVKHFSGAARYSATAVVPAELPAAGRRIALDLGAVHVMARVTLNGRDLGTLWKPPYRADVTGIVKAGENSLEIEVVNLWVNRMVGDEELPEDSERNPDGTLKAWPKWLDGDAPSPAGRVTFTSWRLWRKGSPLRPSGLLGPVTFQAAEEVVVR
ncbi:MAG TPA: hypothetical protein DCM87_10375 [Planctomycetes bacterium]|nr:hypothetical protein [Planctomycetota bacterium]